MSRAFEGNIDGEVLDEAFGDSLDGDLGLWGRKRTPRPRSPPPAYYPGTDIRDGDLGLQFDSQEPAAVFARAAAARGRAPAPPMPAPTPAPAQHVSAKPARCAALCSRCSRRLRGCGHRTCSATGACRLWVSQVCWPKFSSASLVVLAFLGYCLYLLAYLIAHILARVGIFIIPGAVLIAIGAGVFGAATIICAVIICLNAMSKGACFSRADPCNLCNTSFAFCGQGFRVMFLVFSSCESSRISDIEWPDYCDFDIADDDSYADQRRAHYNGLAEGINEQIRRGEAVDEELYRNVRRNLNN